jgi:hypothetical protein
MRRIHLLTLLLAALVTVPLFAVERSSRTNVIDDVIRMQKSGVAEDEIIAFIHKGNARFDVSADDLIALHDAGISRNVIKAVLDEADARGERRDRDDYGYRDRRETVVYSPRFVSVGGWPYYYDPYYYYGGYYYDPFWYGPRFSIGFNFGFGRYYGGRYGYHGGYHGGYRGRHR